MFLIFRGALVKESCESFKVGGDRLHQTKIGQPWCWARTCPDAPIATLEQRLVRGSWKAQIVEDQVHTVVGQSVEEVFLNVDHHVSRTQGQRQFDVRPRGSCDDRIGTEKPTTRVAHVTCATWPARNHHGLGRMPKNSSLGQHLQGGEGRPWA